MPKKPLQAFSRANPDGEEGNNVFVGEDEVLADDDWRVKAWPDMFIDMMDWLKTQMPQPAPVEQATASPGEKRNK